MMAKMMGSSFRRK
ncbi:hypothetical protein TIFTF001_037105 [Ficus carica]|uniref:Uncharacterized protein n=1 Tax=Ficus carica TaxID=3494 RepID=A0AA88E4N6_FICCA|nr:hypothetical protein TIFTF001_037105 [Ficus carica]